MNKTKTTLLDKLPKNKGEHLELLIKFTLRAIDGSESSLNRDMTAQADRLKKELQEWRKNESKNKKITSRRGSPKICKTRR